MKYIIEKNWNTDPDMAIERLEISVNAMISEGWQPLGPAQLVFSPRNPFDPRDEDGFIAMQTLTRVAA